MSDRFIKFNDEQLDAKQVMMLQDLARLLLKNEQTQVKIQKFPYYNPVQNVLNYELVLVTSTKPYRNGWFKNRCYVSCLRLSYDGCTNCK